MTDAHARRVVRVVAAVIRDGARLLVCRRPLHKRHGGLWEFPGGKVHDGETDQQAIARELREELGIAATHVAHVEFESHDPDSGFIICFLPVAIEGAPECIEHSALAWATPGELTSFVLAPSDARFVEWLLNSEAAMHRAS